MSSSSTFYCCLFSVIQILTNETIILKVDLYRFVILTPLQVLHIVQDSFGYCEKCFSIERQTMKSSFALKKIIV